PEVPGVEPGDVVQDGRGPDEVVAPVQLLGNARGLQLVPAETGEASLAVADDAPQVLRRVRTGKPEGHPDHGDARVLPADAHQPRSSRKTPSAGGRTGSSGPAGERRSTRYARRARHPA